MNRSDDYIMGGASGSPNDQWKRIFDEASEAPPPRVWDAVERQLDLDDEDGIIPLWQHHQGQQSMLFGRWAAGIAASLLLTLFGWWAWHRQEGLNPTPANTSQVAVAPKQALPDPAIPSSVQPAATQPKSVISAPVADVTKPIFARRVPTHTLPAQPSLPEPAEQPTLAVNEPAPTEAAKLSEVTTAPAAGRPVVSESTPVGTEMVVTHRQVTTRMTYGQITMSMTTSQAMPVNSFRSSSVIAQPMIGAQPITELATPAQPDVPGLTPPMTTAAAPTEADADRLALNLAPLTIQPLSVRPVGNDRIVWYRAEQPEAGLAEVTKTLSRTDRRKAWLSAGIGAAAFNPTLALRSTSAATRSMAVSDYVQNSGMSAGATQAISSHTGSALTLQVNAGLPLGEHWAVETGVGYLSGQAGVQSPGRGTYAAANNVSSSPTLYTDLISNRLSSNSVAYNATPAGLNYDLTNNGKLSRYTVADQTVSNTYQFVQVPAQVSYEFRPRRKFGLSLLTGLVSNWFVRNTVNQTVSVKPGDGIYRPVTMAGTAGVRFRYRPDQRWSASLAGTFQQQLQSLTLNDVNLQALPQQVGLSFSVDRHF